MRNKFIFLAVISLLIFIVFAAAIPRTTDIDVFLLKGGMSTRIPTATGFFKFITFFGTPAFFYPATAILSLIYYFWRQWRGFAAVIITMVASWIIMEGLKLSFHRNRPALDPLQTASGYSFPSGHAMMGTVFFALLALWLIKKVPLPLRRVIPPVTVIFLFLLGYSRIYLGVHYPTDILAGYAAGTSIFAIFLAWWKEK
ncbi:Phosphatidylglycerophosphatase B [Moorella humiferrea]|uniref:phosphatase PAP2 family protein n=1 Tax=Neomoorella humiferrea TaxID=676965 RepID=UPI0030D51190